jgi:hypothetical protein
MSPDQITSISQKVLIFLLILSVSSVANMAKESQPLYGAVQSLPAEFIPSDLATACTLTPGTTSNTFHCDLKADWAIGVVPHGGYLAALITHAAKEFSLVQHRDLD